MRRTVAALTTALLTAGLLAGCGGDGNDSAGESPSIAASEDFNDADVSFAQDMIPHHAQALQMVDMTMGRQGLSPQMVALTEQIRSAQAPEIEQMTDWLEEWDQEVPETSRDHMNAEGHGGHDMSGMDDTDEMPGMMSEDDMAELEKSGDSAFEDMWLQMMIEHHEGAIEMAKTEIADGEYPDTIALAESIVESQQAEIDQMERMLED